MRKRYSFGAFLRLKLRIGGLLCWDAVYHCLACILYVWQRYALRFERQEIL